MKRKLSLLVIIIVIVAMSMVVITVLAARRSFLISSEGGNLGTLTAQPIGANQRLKEFYGEVVLNLNEVILTELQASEKKACTKKGADQRENDPLTGGITGVVQIEKEKGKGTTLYSFRFKWDESTKLLESVGCTGEFNDSNGTITVTFTHAPFTLKVLLVGKHPKSERDFCDWYDMWPDSLTNELTFIVTLVEEL